MSESSTPSADSRQRLGRGLAALLGAANDAPVPAEAGADMRRVPIEFLNPNPRNPRKRFDDAELAELAESIRARGVLQPILAREAPRHPGRFEIVAGERRWRAAQRAGQSEVPVLVLNIGEKEALEVAIVENVQRTDLNPLEEAAGYAQLGADYGYSHTEIAQVVGKSRSHVANTLRLVGLPEHARQLLAEGRISAGHARALLPLDNPNAVADQIVEKGLTVRDVERLGQAPDRTPRHRATKGPENPDVVALCDRLRQALGVAVTIRCSGETGELRIPFHNLEQLDEFCLLLEANAA